MCTIKYELTAEGWGGSPTDEEAQSYVALAAQYLKQGFPQAEVRVTYNAHGRGAKLIVDDLDEDLVDAVIQDAWGAWCAGGRGRGRKVTA